jgi:transposase
MLKTTSMELLKVEEQMEALIKTDERLKELNEYITSVDGVGRITAAHMLVTTNEFLTIK